MAYTKFKIEDLPKNIKAKAEKLKENERIHVCYNKKIFVLKRVK
jgi:hypothetical protein